MGAASRRKGKGGEREVAAILSAAGFECARGSRNGVAGAEDLAHDCLPGVWFEIKRVERLNVPAAMEQAARDAGPYRSPVVLHRRNRGEWLATVRLEDLLVWWDA